MAGESLLIILVVGLIAGWLAGQIVQGTGFGIVGDLIIGIIGAFIGGWLLPRLGIHLGVGIVAVIIWLMSSSLQPSTPVKARSAITTQVSKPAPASPVQAGLPANSIASAISQGA